MQSFKFPVLLSILLSAGCLFSHAQMNESLPRLVKSNGLTQLFVHGKPYLILGGELGNSTTSDLDYMRPVWLKLKSMRLNTVLAPVYWELLEPQEGKFDFTLVDSMIAGARKQDLKLIFLWFGSWKNSMSCYAPEWIKLNQEKFERAKDSKDKGLEILSAFNKTNLQSDIRAFTALMKHIARVDSRENTVIMIQVENEIGMLTEAREYTPAANLAFHSGVPQELMTYLKKNKNDLVPEFSALWQKNGYLTSGSWEEVFGPGLSTDEIFQAWQYSVYTNAVAAAGKKEYPIPMYVNTALNYKNVNPGLYPSAGPLPHLMDVWQAGAPQIDILSPDFYNPFFIPEIRSEPDNAAKVFLAVGHYKALGFSPFSIESVDTSLEEPITKSYALLEQLSPVILENQVKGKIEGVLLDSIFRKQEILMGKYILTVSHEFTLGWSPGSKNPGWPEAGGIIIQTGNNEFIVAGTGIVVTFSSQRADESVGILQANEGTYINGKWKPGRRMNGDQDHQGRHIRIPVKEYSIQAVRVYNYH
jgi:beta-galactosidase GanA